MTSRRYFRMGGRGKRRSRLGPFAFGRDLSAPLASPYTESGAVGSLTLVQTDGQLSTSGGTLSFPAQATPAWGDQGFYSPVGLARKAGRALLATIRFSAIDVLNGYIVGLGSAANLTVSNLQQDFNFNSQKFAFWNGTINANDLDGDLATAVDYPFAVVMRGTGGFLLLQIGGAWTVLWVDAKQTFSPAYPLLSNYGHVGTIDNFRVVDLPSPFNGDYGIVTQRLAGARSAGDTFSHTADCLVEWTAITLTSAGVIDLRLRQQDATNYWQVTVDSAGTLVLNEVVAGTPTSRGSAAAVVAADHRIVAIADGAVIKVYSNNTLRITYSSASSFATATSGVLSGLGTGGAVSEICSWPRVVALPAGY